MRDRDTLVSTGWDGWQGVFELYPAAKPDGEILERTNRYQLKRDKGSACGPLSHSEDAVSEQDLIATFYDTLEAPFYGFTDVIDGRRHRPLGLKITQRSYAWSLGGERGFILFQDSIRNISRDTLKNVFIGIHMHQDVSHDANWGNGGWDDDIAGFLRTTPSPLGGPYEDTVNVAWVADNDGDPTGNEFDDRSITGVVGVRILSGRSDRMTTSYNWWNGWSLSTAANWGPNRRGSQVVYPAGGNGKPAGDIAKYQVMSNGEIDYDEVESALDHSVDGWYSPIANPMTALDLADGHDPSYTLSIGPYHLPPDSELTFDYAILAVSDFHVEPDAFERYFDPQDPAAFYRHLDFGKLGDIAQLAGWVYDIPGLDTDEDGYRGKVRIIGRDTFYYEGDGVPDFRIAPPPPSPPLQFATREGRIVMRWDGHVSETSLDPFSLVRDFESYRVYMSRSGRTDDWALLAQRDLIDWGVYRWRASLDRWEMESAPQGLTELQARFDSVCIENYGFPFHPDSFDVRRPEAGFLMEVLDERDPSILDSNIYYFAPFDENVMVDDHFYSGAAARDEQISGVIYKVYPDAPADSVAVRDDGAEFHPFYAYEFAIDGLQIAEPIFLAVSASDYGDPTRGIDPQESAPEVNAEEVWPISAATVVRKEHLKPGVYPNPYRMIDDYNAAGWENRRGLEPDPERARQMTFYNVPDTCVVSIWSLDGDLIRRLEHKANPGSSEASVVVWNLITRNTQAIKTGIYIYSVESRFGTDVGKLVIIK